MFDNLTEAEARQKILTLVAEYCDKYHNQSNPFVPGERIPYASRVYDSAEMTALADSALEFWLTAGRFTARFEREFPKMLGLKYCSLVNSGSSANLLAFMALTSPLLESRRVLPGDEVITVAAAFPTTVSPIIQAGCVPVFVDITVPAYNIDVTKLGAALSDKTRAVFLAHTLGNPFDLKSVKDFCGKHKLWLIEDNCDSLGARYTLDGAERYAGTVGDIATSSFYPAHHMTMGEGGAVYTDNALLHKIVRSLRDWGRDCVCPPGHDNLCGHRFDGQYGELPAGYDHKYVYSHFGYNLKATDMQAAIGVAQMEKVMAFTERRRENFSYLKSELWRHGAGEKYILPEETENARASWFGFPITCRKGLNRNEITLNLERVGVQTRNLFSGNILKHPCFDELRAKNRGYRVAGELTETDRVMNDTFWVGVYPGLDEPRLKYMAETIAKG